VRMLLVYFINYLMCVYKNASDKIKQLNRKVRKTPSNAGRHRDASEEHEVGHLMIAVPQIYWGS